MKNFNEKEFRRCVIIKEDRNGCSIECVLGLWGVQTHSYLSAIGEAVRYWCQYKEDGEYDELLNDTKS